MEPNFPNGEYLLTDKVTYRIREPERGDVIVFEAPGVTGEEFIKRIIGLPGEKITIKEGNIHINGQKLEESYLADYLRTPDGPFLRERAEIMTPPDNYFVLGDNRTSSSDSRVWGFVAKEKITGRAWVVYWPPPKVGLIKEVNYNLN